MEDIIVGVLNIIKSGIIVVSDKISQAFSGNKDHQKDNHHH